MSSDLLPVRVTIPEPAETVWLDLLQYSPPIRFGVCYIPHATSDHVAAFLTALDSAAPVDSETPLLVAGDFNLRFANWSSYASAPGDPQSGVTQSVLDACSIRGLSQSVTEPTHTKGGLLDVVLSSDPCLVENTTVGALFSDHRVVSCTLGPLAATVQRQRWDDWNSADFDSMAAELQLVDWVAEFSICADVDQMWSVIHNYLSNLSRRFVPSRSSSHPKFLYTSHPRTKRLIRQKSRLTGAIARERDTERRQILVERRDLLCDRLCSTICHLDQEKQEEIALARNSTVGTKKFFAYARSKTHLKRGLPALVCPATGRVATTDQEKAEMLNQVFCSVFLDDNGQLPLFPKRTDQELRSVSVEDEVIFAHMMLLPPKTSTGPDGIPQLLLKNLAQQLAHPLGCLFRLCIASGRVPQQWKVATVVPIFKSGDPFNPSNYRPVSLTSSVSRLFECLLKEAIEHFLEPQQLICPQQHGFRKRHSVETQLLEATNDWTLALERSLPTDVIYLDLKRAFDKVSHPKLLAKCAAYGLAGPLLDCLADFLGGRQQSVRVETALSSFVPVESGVPQGAVLSPLLFTIFINDMPEKVSNGTKIRLFANDAKLYRSISCPGDTGILQADVNSLDQ